MRQIFTYEFLGALAEKAKDMDILSFLIDYQGMSFQQAILALAEFYEMEPQYYEMDTTK